MNVTIIGTGSWGIALASLLTENKHKVKMWSRAEWEAKAINEEHTVERYLPGFMIPKEIVVHLDMEEALKDSEVIVLAVPSVAIRDTAKSIKPFFNNQIVINVAKGLEASTLKRFSQVIKEELPSAKEVTLSGPSHAEEVSKKYPTVVAVASEDKEVRHIVADIFRNEYFRVYPNEDITGVEIAGALKNVIALCAGISDGLGLGDNTKAALITRGLAEITRLGMKMGCKPETFSGLAGLGDLVVTCASVHSRNHKAGVLIGQGMSPKQAVEEVKMVVEGINNAKAAKALGEKYNIELPIIEQANKVIFEDKKPREALLELMLRDKKEET